MCRLILLCILLCGCTGKSPEGFLAQGRAINQELLSELETIHDLEALLAQLPFLERHFNQLVDVMIEARKYQIRKKCTWQPTDEDRKLCLELAREFARLYQIPGAKSLIEKSQEGALLKLDAFETKIRKNSSQ